ncbi:MAG: hypothetical protein COV95_00770 [Candidatus Zambryskibacteria bacterium CG11_big_fil_rev_8_21_14_0_20_40_24]|uniref:Uncharacterized protein n=1 Tax=Candidatus Zambryskibacteria bacterium CG11_big_fil_rev_8_21_14_0_20_40_24 TaxID=1975116 RepID=A0A2H0K709_9BACT|nr:MAG: hypothetical protein COV95_00770 [Candidatus Zambryskibacteria bacterium CG11_big_fil_rev_8_21_14_0_20_40_24]
MVAAVADATHDLGESPPDPSRAVPHQDGDEQLIVAHTVQARDPNRVRPPRRKPLSHDILVDEDVQGAIPVVDDDDRVAVIKREVEGTPLPTEGYRATRGGEKQKRKKNFHCNLPGFARNE